MKSLTKAAIDYAFYNYEQPDHPIAEAAWRDGYREAKINTKQRNIFWFCMGVVFTVLFCLVAGVSFGQDSVRAKIIKTAEHTVVYEINKMRFISYDCPCSTLKRGDTFMIPRARFDSLLREAKPVYKRQL